MTKDFAQYIWRDDIDSLAFQPSGRESWCMVHRQAFRVLFDSENTPTACCDFFVAKATIFQQAAAQKIQRLNIPSDRNFHLNSRDIRRVV